MSHLYRMTLVALALVLVSLVPACSALETILPLDSSLTSTPTEAPTLVTPIVVTVVATNTPPPTSTPTDAPADTPTLTAAIDPNATPIVLRMVPVQTPITATVTRTVTATMTTIITRTVTATMATTATALSSPTPPALATIPATGSPAISRTPPATGTPTAAMAATLAATLTAQPSRTETPRPTAPPARVNQINLSACATIWEPGYYKLTSDIKTPEYDCFYVQSRNVVFDCDNHTIEGNNYQGHGFFVRKWGFPLQQTPENIEIKNCRVLHHRTGIFVGGGIKVNIHDNNLSDNLDTVDKARFGIFLGMTEGGGLRLDSVKGGVAENNITNNEAIGIDVRDSDSVIVRSNTANHNSAWGISLLNTSHSQVVRNTVRDNIRYCAWGDGAIGRGCDAGGIILQDGASHNLVSGNVVAGENGNGIFIKAHASRCGDDNEIRGNTITDAVYNAVEFSFCTGNRVIGNTISGSYDAIWFGFSSNVEIRDNVINNMNNHGIISYNSRNSVVENNRVTASREGIFFYWDTWDPKRFFFLTPTPDNYASRNNVIQNNTLRDNAVAGVHLSNSVQNTIAGNSFTNNGQTIWVEGKNTGNQINQ